MDGFIAHVAHLDFVGTGLQVCQCIEAVGVAHHSGFEVFDVDGGSGRVRLSASTTRPRMTPTAGSALLLSADAGLHNTVERSNRLVAFAKVFHLLAFMF